jgi:DNA-binding GntR family transcriptional regulator
MRERRGPSLTADVYDHLREAVLHGTLSSGERLHLGNLARANGVSLGVVREAVTRLASERLLEATPQSGFRVRPLSAQHLADLTDTRCQLERAAITESIIHGDTAWEGNVVAAHHVLRVTPSVMPDDTVNPGWMDAHRRFHATLVGGCPNAILLELRQRLFDEAELYRHRSAEHDGRERDIDDEHQGLVHAVLDRDAIAATSLIEAHIRATAAYAVANLADTP